MLTLTITNKLGYISKGISVRRKCHQVKCLFRFPDRQIKKIIYCRQKYQDTIRAKADYLISFPCKALSWNTAFGPVFYGHLILLLIYFQNHSHSSFEKLSWLPVKSNDNWKDRRVPVLVNFVNYMRIFGRCADLAKTIEMVVDIKFSTKKTLSFRLHYQCWNAVIQMMKCTAYITELVETKYTWCVYVRKNVKYNLTCIIHTVNMHNHILSDHRSK